MRLKESVYVIAIIMSFYASGRCRCSGGGSGSGDSSNNSKQSSAVAT